jgi:DNA repair ATPase RecN
MKLTGLRIEGLRKIKCAELDFDGQHLVEIRGRNQAGKSTVIDSILWLFKGTRAIPKDVVTHGMERGEIIGEVGEYTVRRVVKPDGTSNVTVEGANGKVPKAQEFLDQISGQFLDPEYFMSLSSADKRKVVMQYAGIDFTDIDARIAAAEQNRLLLGRELKSLGTIPPEPENVKEVVITELLEELRTVNEHNKKQDELQTKIEDCIDFLKNAARNAIEGKTLEEIRHIIFDYLPSFYESRKTEIEALGKPDYKPTDEITGKIANAESINTKARAYQAYLDKKKAVEEKKAEYDKATDAIEEFRREKANMVLGAKLPVKGLTITDTGLVFNGTTDENWSDSEGLKIALKIAVAWSGDIKAVYIKRGEAFDTASLEKTG